MFYILCYFGCTQETPNKVMRNRKDAKTQCNTHKIDNDCINIGCICLPLFLGDSLK